MHYAVILAGGAGTRLWPMSLSTQPKQIIPFIGGRSLLQIAYERLAGLIAPEKLFICAGNHYKDHILSSLKGFRPDCFLGEPAGRDTLNAIAYCCAVIHKQEPRAAVGIFTADHIIEPVALFRETVQKGFRLVDEHPRTLVTFGIKPESAATGFGYLKLGPRQTGPAQKVERFCEKPDAATARDYFRAGPQKYLWNSGMFLWKAGTFLECVRQFEPAVHAQISTLAQTWGTPAFASALDRIYPRLKKISVDYAIMEPASAGTVFPIAAIPMDLKWIDVGSWNAYAGICNQDRDGNAAAAPRYSMVDSRNNLIVSDTGEHIIAGIGLEDMIIVHTEKATLICPKSRAQEIKQLHGQIRAQFKNKYI